MYSSSELCRCLPLKVVAVALVVSCILQAFTGSYLSSPPASVTSHDHVLRCWVQDKLCDSLEDVLGSMRLFLELELQVEMFIHEAGECGRYSRCSIQ